MVSIEEFAKIELITARIKEVKDHPNADRLFVMKVDDGTNERQLVAGIRGAYQAEELVGRQIIIVSNLEPATIRGEESHGMLLAVKDENGLALLRPDREVAPGKRVK